MRVVKYILVLILSFILWGIMLVSTPSTIYEWCYESILPLIAIILVLHYYRKEKRNE